jgi:hypothetical protein
MSRGADLTLTLWIIFVGVVYFGGFYSPAVGELTWSLRFVYLAMLLGSLLYKLLARPRTERKANRKGDRR